MKNQIYAWLVLAALLLTGCTVNIGNTKPESTAALTIPVVTESAPDKASETLTAGSETNPAEETESSADPASTDEITVSVNGIVLKYPAKWLDVVTIETEADAVHFSSLDIPLFDLFFDGRGKPLGTIQKNGTVLLGLKMYTQSQDELRISAMRDDLNYILDNLRKDYGFEIAKDGTPGEEEVFPIETPVVTLYYPVKWKDSIEIESTEDSALFSTEGTKLFELVFHESEGYYLGAYNEIPIYLKTYELSEDSHFAMQEDVNVIIQHLMEDERFVKG